jgi:hypothetical protein
MAMVLDGPTTLDLKKVVPSNLAGVVEMPVRRGLNISGLLAPASSHRALLVVTGDRRRSMRFDEARSRYGRPGRFGYTYRIWFRSHHHQPIISRPVAPDASWSATGGSIPRPPIDATQPPRSIRFHYYYYYYRTFLQAWAHAERKSSCRGPAVSRGSRMSSRPGSTRHAIACFWRLEPGPFVYLSSTRNDIWKLERYGE